MSPTVALLLVLLGIVGLTGAATVAHLAERHHSRWHRTGRVGNCGRGRYCGLASALENRGRVEAPPMRQGGRDRPFDWKKDDPTWLP